MVTGNTTEMEYRLLGRSGLKVSVLSLGGWLTYGGQADHGTPTNKDTTAECMKVAYDNGINFFDTAEGYPGSEVAMGLAIKKFNWKRSSLVISTKIYFGSDQVNDRGLSRKHIVEGTRACLARLGLDYVDLIYAHRPDDLTPMEEIVRSFNWLIEHGMAFYWGTSEWSAEQLSDAHAVASRLGLIAPVMEQPEYSLFKRERFEKEYAPLYKKYGMGTTIWSPLASGILTGKYNREIPADSRLGSSADPYVGTLAQRLKTPEGISDLAKVAKMIELAQELDCTAAQVALAWCIKNPNVSSVITGASKPSQVLENCKCLAVLPKLTDAVMARIEDVFQNAPSKAVARH